MSLLAQREWKCTTVTPARQQVFDYVEETDVMLDGWWTPFREAFRIRHLPAEEFGAELEGIGFAFERDYSARFEGTGPPYWLLRKPEVGP